MRYLVALLLITGCGKVDNVDTLDYEWTCSVFFDGMFCINLNNQEN